MKSSKVFFAAVLLSGSLMAQTSPSPTRKSSYIFPVWPGKTNTLSGSMGELRATHFHSGIDIRTNNKVGAPIVAAREGFVSRAVKSPFGYGNVLYVTHPDGNTTVYAHLDEFTGPLAVHVRSEQYRTKASKIELYFKPGEFPVKKGGQIGISGNTGSSNGPHLHFDLRDPAMNAINPLSYGFPEIIDNMPPVVDKIAVRTMDAGSRVNGRFGRFIFKVVKDGETYRPAEPINATGTIGIELLARDVMNNSGFRFGINEFIVKANDSVVFHQQIKRIEMAITRGILSVLDHEEMEDSGDRYYRMYVADGNPLNMYPKTVNQGLIRMSGDQRINISFADSYGNTGSMAFTLSAAPPAEKVVHPDGPPPPPGFLIDGHHLLAKAPLCDSVETRIYSKGQPRTVKPEYRDGHLGYYILDLRTDIPDSLVTCFKTLRFNSRERVPSHTAYTLYGKGFSLHFPDKALFDTLYIHTESVVFNGRPALIAGERPVPLLKPVQLEWTPDIPLTPHHAVFRQEGSRYIHEPSRNRNGTLSFESNRLGTFVLMEDRKAPQITLLSAGPDAARFRIKDERSGISSYEATVNGEWIILNYDYKTGILFTEKKDANTPLKGELLLKVRDNCGNSSSLKRIIP